MLSSEKSFQPLKLIFVVEYQFRIQNSLTGELFGYGQTNFQPNIIKIIFS